MKCHWPYLINVKKLNQIEVAGDVDDNSVMMTTIIMMIITSTITMTWRWISLDHRLMMMSGGSGVTLDRMVCAGNNHLLMIAEVQVRIRNCGICGTDIYMWSTGQCGHETSVVDPLVIGHECSGVVTAVANDVKHLKVGQCTSSGQFTSSTWLACIE